MYCEGCSEPIEMQSVVRQQNRALRRIVGILRRRSQRQKAYTDDLFVALCETPTVNKAESAMRELWVRTGLDCSPENYEYIVEMAVRCINQTQDESGSSTVR